MATAKNVTPASVVVLELQLTKAEADLCRQTLRDNSPQSNRVDITFRNRDERALFVGIYSAVRDALN